MQVVPLETIGIGAPDIAQRLAGEGYLSFFARRHGIAGVALRFANVYGPPGVYNVATGTETDVRTLFARLAAVLRPGTLPVHGPPVAGEPRRSALDPSRAETTLGFRFAQELEAGLARTAEWFHDRFREAR